MALNNTIIVDIDLVSDIKKTISLNDDITIDNDDTKRVIYSADDNALARVVKTIGSPVKIIKADILTPDFLAKNLVKK